VSAWPRWVLLAIEDGTACANGTCGAGTGVGSGLCELASQRLLVPLALFLGDMSIRDLRTGTSWSFHNRRVGPWAMNYSNRDQHKVRHDAVPSGRKP
jgi:hypothetical protein